MADASKYAGKRAATLKTLCNQRKIEYDEECEAPDLIFLLEEYDNVLNREEIEKQTGPWVQDGPISSKERGRRGP